MPTFSRFLPSRPPPTPACYLHPHLPHAALTHQRTPLPIFRLRPLPTPTLVSVFVVLVNIRMCDCWLIAIKTVSASVYHTGLISPGVSVPVQVPGTEQQGMNHNLGQYWARLQWATDNLCPVATEPMKKKGGKKGYIFKKIITTRGRHRFYVSTEL